jgi:hypothetical protein
MDRRVVTIVLAVAAIALSLVPVATAARAHSFRAKYTGTGTGQQTATGVTGQASGSGTGNLIGPSTLKAAATGIAQSSDCFAVNARFTLKGRGGKIFLRVQGDRICASDTSNVAFSGTTTVTGGTRTFAGSRGTLSFKGTYVKETQSVTISFKGRVTY